ncbi:hypothetical protein [Flavobacterium sp.]|uniref:hypothetical protein n=1 Tax=Flavobacterium sp. TaxID=239 RepID=UPI0026363FB5|nr:hypothetical protein [Flavobacterium sp.]
MNEIILPHANNTTIPIQDLIHYFQLNKLNYLIIGSNKVTLTNHRKPNSLDVWLRTHPKIVNHKDTCQSVNKVITQIIKHQSFSQGLRKCPKSKRICKALVFCDHLK